MTRRSKLNDRKMNKPIKRKMFEVSDVFPYFYLLKMSNPINIIIGILACINTNGLGNDGSQKLKGNVIDNGTEFTINVSRQNMGLLLL